MSLNTDLNMDAATAGNSRPQALLGVGGEYRYDMEQPGMDIQYDRYSMRINGQRTLIRSGAMHYFRIPGQNLWRDRLYKLKAAGYNTVDLYFNWGYHSPEPGVYDFTGIRDVRKLLEITRELGLMVIARPGPYINAEVSGGGFPGWLLARKDLPLRHRIEGAFTWSQEYMDFVAEWWRQIIPIINESDNVLMVQIENEYASLEVEPDYMQALYDLTRELGVKVPLFHNDLYVAGLYADIVDIYAFDNYSVTQFEKNWREMPEIFQVLDNVEGNLRPFCENSPLMVAELQAGWYGSWKGYKYEEITEYLGREHIGLSTRSVIGQGLTIVNHYKAIGGTNWDHLGSTETYTSYDFGAPISEAGINTERLYETKALNYFLATFNLLTTERVYETPFTLSTDHNVYTIRRNVEAPGEHWIFLRNLTEETSRIAIDTDYEVTLEPFEGLILPYGAQLASGFTLQYATVEAVYQTANKLILKGNRPARLKLVPPNPALEQEIVLSGNRDLHNQLHITRDSDGGIIIACAELDHQDIATVRIGDLTLFLLGQHMVDTLWLQENGDIVLGAATRLPGDAFGIDETTTLHVIDGRTNTIRDIPAEPKPMPRLPELAHWTASHEAQELYSRVSFHPVSPEGADFDANRVYEGSGWYRYEVPTGGLQELTIDARHIWAVFLNGHLLESGQELQLIHGMEPPPPASISIPQHLLRHNPAEPDELVIFTDMLGHPKGFHDDAQTPGGLLQLKADGRDITASVTFSPGFSSRKKDLLLACGGADNPIPRKAPVVRFKTRFALDFDRQVYDIPLGVQMNGLEHYTRINIYLNGVLVGRHWNACQRQDTFYLPDDLLKFGNGQENTLELLVMHFNPFLPLEESVITAEHVSLQPYRVFTKVGINATLKA